MCIFDIVYYLASLYELNFFLSLIKIIAAEKLPLLKHCKHHNDLWFAKLILSPLRKKEFKENGLNDRFLTNF